VFCVALAVLDPENAAQANWVPKVVDATVGVLDPASDGVRVGVLDGERVGVLDGAGINEVGARLGEFTGTLTGTLTGVAEGDATSDIALVTTYRPEQVVAL